MSEYTYNCFPVKNFASFSKIPEAGQAMIRTVILQTGLTPRLTAGDIQGPLRDAGFHEGFIREEMLDMICRQEIEITLDGKVRTTIETPFQTELPIGVGVFLNYE